MLERIRKLIRYAIGTGKFRNKRDFGEKIGWGNSSAFYQLLAGKKPLPKDFIDRLCALVPEANRDWILTGNGSMVNYILSSTAKIIDTPTADKPKVAPTVDNNQVAEELSALRAERAQMLAIIQKNAEAIANANAALADNATALKNATAALERNSVTIDGLTQKGRPASTSAPEVGVSVITDTVTVD